MIGLGFVGSLGSVLIPIVVGHLCEGVREHLEDRRKRERDEQVEHLEARVENLEERVHKLSKKKRKKKDR